MGEDTPKDHPDANLPLHGPNQWPAEVSRPVELAAFVVGIPA